MLVKCAFCPTTFSSIRPKPEEAMLEIVQDAQKHILHVHNKGEAGRKVEATNQGLMTFFSALGHLLMFQVYLEILPNTSGNEQLELILDAITNKCMAYVEEVLVDDEEGIGEEGSKGDSIDFNPATVTGSNSSLNEAEGNSHTPLPETFLTKGKSSQGGLSNLKRLKKKLRQGTVTLQ